MKSQFWRVVFLVLVITNGSCSSKKNGDPESPARDSTASVPAPSIEEWRESAFAGKDPRKIWELYSQAAQAQLAEPGADPSDIEAKAASLGRDSRKIFEFMRDQVALEPYAGVLRGARGTLATGAGNALDRALLAQALLKTSGIESRLVEGKLSSAQTGSLLARFLSGNAAPGVLADLDRVPDDADLKAEAVKLAAIVGLPEDKVHDQLSNAREQGQQLQAAIDIQRAAQFDFLDGKLRSGGVDMEIDGAALSAMLKERLSDHYWLQVREPDGNWTEFDPTFPDARPGTAYGTGPAQLPAIPEESFHRLEFQLVYHTRVDGAPKEDVLIAESIASADSLFEPLEFRIQPFDLSVQPGAFGAMASKQKIEVLRKVTRFQGVLRAGSKTFGSRSFDFDGVVDDAGASPLGTPGGTFFGDSLGGGEEMPPEFVKLEVVMRLVGPRREPMSQTRVLLRSEELLAPDYAPPLVEWHLLLQPQWVSADFVRFRALKQVVATGDALMKSTSAGQSFPAVEPPPSVPIPLLQMALLRQRAAAIILTKQGGVRAFVDEPMLTIFGRELTGIDDQAGQILAIQHIDIVENGIRYLPRNDASRVAAFDAALRQGVADSAIEDRMLSQAFPGSDARSGTTIFEQASAEKRAAMLASSRDTDELKAMGVPRSDVEWIRDNESPAARLLIATTADGAAAWWSVRPDGNAILRAAGGRGAAQVEYNFVSAKVAFATLCVVTHFQMSMKHLGSVYTSQQFAAHEEESARSFLKCVVLSSLAGVSLIGGIYAHGWHFVSYGLMFFELYLTGEELAHLAH
jgi:transglutaminase-like putative cysteine protease